MGKNNGNNSSRNLDSALIKVYYDKVELSYIIITREKYYLLFTDESILEIIHLELHEDDIFKIVLLIDEAGNIVHQSATTPGGLQEMINKYFS
ncbi:MAG: hypothetical protein WAM24_08670 [Ignavibacteriaceae bacterium]